MRRYAFAEPGDCRPSSIRNCDQAGEGLDPLLLSIDVGPGALKRILQNLIARRTDVTAAWQTDHPMIT